MKHYELAFQEVRCQHMPIQGICPPEQQMAGASCPCLEIEQP